MPRKTRGDVLVAKGSPGASMRPRPDAAENEYGERVGDRFSVSLQ